MKKTGMLLLALSLAACDQSAPTDTIESLVANPERLKEVRRLRKEDHAKMGDATCNAAAGTAELIPTTSDCLASTG